MALNNRRVRIANQILAAWKWCLSFRKRDWDLSDYPIIFRTQEPDPTSPYHSPRFKLHRHIATVVNWNLSGNGDSHEEALQCLRNNFSEAKAKKMANGEPLPRPGTHVPIGFLSQERINANRELADDFTHRVLDHPEAWISDGSSLWDFHTEDTNDAYYARIMAVYGVDVSDIESANLAEILERIASTQRDSLNRN
jgi:hypothetical protein